jgi:hypothetical protein
METIVLKILGILGLFLQTSAGFLFLLDQVKKHTGLDIENIIRRLQKWGNHQLKSRVKVLSIGLFFAVISILLLYFILQSITPQFSDLNQLFPNYFMNTENIIENIKNIIVNVTGRDFQNYLFVINLYLILQIFVRNKIMRKLRIFSRIKTDNPVLHVIITNVNTFIISLIPIMILLVLAQIPALKTSVGFAYLSAFLVFLSTGIAILSLFFSLSTGSLKFFTSLPIKLFWLSLLVMWASGGVLLIVVGFLAFS